MPKILDSTHSPRHGERITPGWRASFVLALHSSTMLSCKSPWVRECSRLTALCHTLNANYTLPRFLGALLSRIPSFSRLPLIWTLINPKLSIISEVPRSETPKISWLATLAEQCSIRVHDVCLYHASRRPLYVFKSAKTQGNMNPSGRI
jgi:hypothetical protein